jgi:hypothetical protein
MVTLTVPVAIHRDSVVAAVKFRLLQFWLLPVRDSNNSRGTISPMLIFWDRLFIGYDFGLQFSIGFETLKPIVKKTGFND